MIRATRVLYLLGAISLLALGLAWIAANASLVPAYGDTSEYLELARTLQVDEYRTILYPAVLRFGGAVRGDGRRPRAWSMPSN